MKEVDLVGEHGQLGSINAGNRNANANAKIT